MTTAPDPAEGPIEDVVVLRLGQARYAVAMAAVAEVGRPLQLTRVPGMPAWLAGVVNWRGRILAVVDLRGLLAADTAPPATRLVVLVHDGVLVGLLADAVVGTARLPAPPDTAPGTVDARAAALLAGQVTDADGPLAVLDVAAVFRLRDELPRRRVA